MKRFTLPLACVVCLFLPTIASAALALNIGPQGPGRVDVPFALPGQQFFDLNFVETAPTENEGLFAYDVLVIVPAAARNLITLGGAEKPADNFVLDVPSGATFSVAESDASHVLINVSSNNELADITTGKRPPASSIPSRLQGLWPPRTARLRCSRSTPAPRSSAPAIRTAT
jgi:hypothetical protein